MATQVARRRIKLLDWPFSVEHHRYNFGNTSYNTANHSWYSPCCVVATLLRLVRRRHHEHAHISLPRISASSREQIEQTPTKSRYQPSFYISNKRTWNNRPEFDISLLSFWPLQIHSSCTPVSVPLTEPLELATSSYRP